MIHWTIALILALLLTMFGVLGFLFALAMWMRFCIEIFSLRDVDGVWGWAWLAACVLPFTYIVGNGAVRLIGAVVGGFIGRFA